ncbi:maleylpyruvate isomerase family mycothiol-dependent enzyme [Actinoplanes sp. NPDC051861]|uniref:maleylpyruvate isomerase family mycothiol-dependent enzyme n=1 Tax=Actinoplanes sp. NPDC051861 TaxID=3155170 RepID=UPI00343D1AAA
MDHLALLRQELSTFAGYVDRDLSVPVEHCEGWTLRDLVVHLGEGNLWAATAVTEMRGDHRPAPPPEELGAWFDSSSRTLVKALEADAASPAWTFAEPRTVAFWRRRRWLETVIHRWDAENALGLPAQLDPAQSADGVAEVIEMFVPRQVRKGRCAPLPAAVRFTASDLGVSWLLGPGEPVATLTGTAPEIFLALWGRAPWSALSGDHDAARDVVRGPLVP